MQKRTITVKKVEFKEISRGDDLSEQICYRCQFCQQTIDLPPYERQLCEKLSGNDEIYCVSCLRNGLNSRNNRHVLIMTFRAIIGYYYHAYYKNPNHRRLCLSQIDDLIETHKEIGLKNPVFTYNDDSMLWFVDFNRVGRGKKKLDWKDVTGTLEEILKVFQTPQLLRIDLEALNEKYYEAMWLFYTQRSRPQGRRILAPTLKHVAHIDRKVSMDTTRKFTRKNLVRRG